MIARLLISGEPGKAIIKEGINLNQPDTLYFKAGQKIGIAEARKIKEHFSLKPYSEKGRTAVIEDAQDMTEEAQNALLKTIEELPKEAAFLIGASSESNLLPTVISRCRLEYVGGGNQQTVETGEGEKLLKASLEERFEYIGKLKNREELLLSLASYFHKKILKYPEFTAKILEAEKWQKQNVNIRAVLEYLMLEMPHRK